MNAQDDINIEPEQDLMDPSKINVRIKVEETEPRSMEVGASGCSAAVQWSAVQCRAVLECRVVLECGAVQCPTPPWPAPSALLLPLHCPLAPSEHMPMGERT